MRDGLAACYRAVMVGSILFVGLAAAAAAVDVFFLAPEDPDDEDTRAGRRFIPINVGWVLIAGDNGGVDPESWDWDPDDKVEKVPNEPETATYTSAQPDQGAWVRVSASGESGPDTEETTKVVIYAADLDADAVTDPDPNPSDDPEEDPGLFIGAGDVRQKITLATVPGDLLPHDEERDLDGWEVDLSVDGLGEAVSLWKAASDGEPGETDWSAHWDGQEWVCNSGAMPSQLWIQGDQPGTGSIGLNVYIEDACDDPPQQGAYDYIQYRVIAVDMDAQGVPIDEEEEHPGALVELGGTTELQINGPSYCSEPADGTLTLSWTNGARVNVWKDAEKTQSFGNGDSFTVAQLQNEPDLWETLHVEGEQVSGSAGDVKFTLDYNGDGIHTKDTVNFTVAELNAQAEGVADEEDPGAFVGWNTDDDNGNGTPDVDDPQVGGGDDDLLAVTVNAPEPGFLDPDSDEVTVNWFGSGIGVYADQEKANPLDQGDTFGKQGDWPVEEADWPVKVYVEGADTSTQSPGAQVKVSYSRGGVSAEDQIAFTVVAADLVAWQLAGGGEPDPAELDPGLFVCVNVDDDPQNLQTLTLDALPDECESDSLKISWAPAGKVAIWKHADMTGAVSNGATFTIEQLKAPDSEWENLYVEGVEPSDALRDVEFTLDYLHEGTALHTDLIKATVVEVDLDVDSDNDNGLNAPERDVNEDQIEDIGDDPQYPGKFLCVNEGDDDGDSIPEFADGFDWDGSAGNDDDANPQDRFVPLVLELPVPVDPSAATVRVTYDESPPADVTRTGSGTPDDPYVYWPAGGTLRVWRKDGSESRSKRSANAETSPGDYVAAGTYEPSQLGISEGTRTVTLYVEGVQASSAVADQRISVEVDPDGDGPVGSVAEDGVRATVVRADLDIDSDNDDGFGRPEENRAEDQYEDVQGEAEWPGKYVETNRNDDDHDCVPDFADGFNRDGNTGNVDDSCLQETFVPLVLKIDEPIRIAEAKLKITYNQSDPGGTTRTGAEPLYSWAPASGKLRVWTKNGDEPRNGKSVNAASDPGDYVPADTYQDLSKLGLAESTRSVTLYVETVDGSVSVADQQIKIELDPDGTGPAGWVCGDGVRLTSVRADLDIDSDNNGSIEDPDDPIEAEAPGCILPKDLEGDSAGEDWVTEITLDITPELPAGKVVLDCGTGLKIWEDSAQTIEVTVPKSYDPPSTLPSSLYVDGTNKQSTPEIELTYKDPADLQLASDKVQVLVTETPSWSPAKADAASVWCSLPRLGTYDAEVFRDEIEQQGFQVEWWEDSTGYSDNDFQDCTLSNYKNMADCGAFCVISHGLIGAHAAVYATDTSAGQSACNAWIGTESNMTTVRAQDSGGWFFFVRVSSDWHSANYAPSLDANRAIAFWDMCYGAQGSSTEGAVKEAAGGRWRIGYWNPTHEAECVDTNIRFLRRMNGATDSARRRTAGEAWDGGTNYSSNARMHGNDWTTLCPPPMADDAVFPASDPGEAYGWGCIIFDTSMNYTISATQALMKLTGCPTYEHEWRGNIRGRFILGFDYDKTPGTTTTMRAVGEHSRNADPDGGRRLDGNRVRPNDTSANPDNRDWSF